MYWLSFSFVGMFKNLPWRKILEWTIAIGIVLSLVFWINRCRDSGDLSGIDAVLEHTKRVDESLKKSMDKIDRLEQELKTIRGALEILAERELESIEAREGIENELRDAGTISDIDCLVYGDCVTSIR